MRDIIGNTVQERIKSILEPHWRCLEIGAGWGETTKVLCQNTAFTTVIDPFQYIEGSDRTYFDPYPRQAFFDSMRGIENWRLLQTTTNDINPLENIDFAFVDGLQDYLSVFKDLVFCRRVKVICVDDYNREGVRNAVNDFIGSRPCQTALTEREIYLWK